MSKEVETVQEWTTETISNVEKSYTDPVTGKFVKGNPGGGRPPGSVSIITRLKQIFEEDPEEFEKFIKEYKSNPLNQRHIVEMIDGKPRQSIGLDGGEDENGNKKPIMAINYILPNKQNGTDN